MYVEAEHQKPDWIGQAPPAPVTSCPQEVGTEGCAALVSFPNPFSPLPFYLPLPGPPTLSWPFRHQGRAFPWGLSSPLSLELLQGARMNIQLLWLLPHIFYLFSQGARMFYLHLYRSFMWLLLVCRKVGGKGIREVGARGRWSQMAERKGTHFFQQGFSFFRKWATALFMLYLLRLAGYPSSSWRPHPEGLREEYLSLQHWKMTSLLKCMNFYLQRTFCFHPKEVLCKEPRTRLTVYEPVKYTAHSPDLFLLACNLLYLLESCNLSKTVGRNWATIMPGYPNG